MMSPDVVIRTALILDLLILSMSTILNTERIFEWYFLVAGEIRIIPLTK